MPRPCAHCWRSGLTGLRAAVWWFVLLALAAWVSAESQTTPQAPMQRPPAPLTELQAAYLFNFGRFVEWPGDGQVPEGEAFRIGIAGNEALEVDLWETVRGRLLAGRVVEVKRVTRAEDVKGCRIVFIDEAVAYREPEILAAAEGEVLTVGASPEFLQRGGMVRLARDGDRLQLEVRHRAAEAAGLRLSPRLLAIARIVPEEGRR